MKKTFIKPAVILIITYPRIEDKAGVIFLGRPASVTEAAPPSRICPNAGWQILNPIAAAKPPRPPKQPRRRRGAVVQMLAVQNHNPIAAKFELILLMRSGMGNFHNCFHDVLIVDACLTILGYVIMLLSHLSPRDYEFVLP